MKYLTSKGSVSSRNKNVASISLIRIEREHPLLVRKCERIIRLTSVSVSKKKRVSNYVGILYIYLGSRHICYCHECRKYAPALLEAVTGSGHADKQ